MLLLIERDILLSFAFRGFQCGVTEFTREETDIWSPFLLLRLCSVVGRRVLFLSFPRPPCVFVLGEYPLPFCLQASVVLLGRGISFPLVSSSFVGLLHLRMGERNQASLRSCWLLPYSLVALEEVISRLFLTFLFVDVRIILRPLYLLPPLWLCGGGGGYSLYFFLPS